MAELPENPGSSSEPARGAGPAGQRLALVIATVAGAGYGPIAPGTWGSAVALPLFWPLSYLSASLYALCVAALLALGIWAAGRAEVHFGRKDDGRIVIDEVVGQLLTLAPLLPLRHAGLDLLTWGGLLVTGFVVFRGFDIWKPGPARWAERSFPGGAGVMLDDVVAGVFGALVMAGVVIAWRALPGAAV